LKKSGVLREKFERADILVSDFLSVGSSKQREENSDSFKRRGRRLGGKYKGKNKGGTFWE